jgi:hypothetical protein
MNDKDLFEQALKGNSGELPTKEADERDMVNIPVELPRGIVYRKHCETTLKNVLDILSLFDGHLLINSSIDVSNIYSTDKNLAATVLEDGTFQAATITATTIGAIDSSDISLLDRNGNTVLKTGDTKILVDVIGGNISELEIQDKGGTTVIATGKTGSTSYATIGDIRGVSSIVADSTMSISDADGKSIMYVKSGKALGLVPLSVDPPDRNATYPRIEFGKGALMSRVADADVWILGNAYYKESTDTWHYRFNGSATYLLIDPTGLFLLTAVSGSKDDTITWIPVWHS